MKKAAHGRIFVAVLFIFCTFFSNLHGNYTLDSDNSNELIKHLTSLIPLSTFQLFIIGIYQHIRDSDRSITWKDSNVDIPFPPIYAFMWLLIDCILYFLLFILFNAMNPREFGASPLKW
jgi:hypothetical protein